MKLWAKATTGAAPVLPVDGGTTTVTLDRAVWPSWLVAIQEYDVVTVGNTGMLLLAPNNMSPATLTFTALVVSQVSVTFWPAPDEVAGLAVKEVITGSGTVATVIVALALTEP